MYKRILMLFALSLSACSPARFDITAAPAGATPDQQKLAATQCERKNHVDGPWFLGIGSAIMHGMRKDGYQECMHLLGYQVVERG